MESSVESLVRRYEKHFKKTRQRLAAHQEIYITKNGQILEKPHKLLKKYVINIEKAKSKGVCGITYIQMTQEDMHPHA